MAILVTNAIQLLWGLGLFCCCCWYLIKYDRKHENMVKLCKRSITKVFHILHFLKIQHVPGTESGVIRGDGRVQVPQYHLPKLSLWQNLEKEEEKKKKKLKYVPADKGW